MMMELGKYILREKELQEHISIKSNLTNIVCLIGLYTEKQKATKSL